MDEKLQAIRIGDVLDFLHGIVAARGTCVGWRDTPELGRCVIILDNTSHERYVPLARVLGRHRVGHPTVTFE